MPQTDFVTDRFVGDSPYLQRLREQVRRLASFRCSVLITGPSGTGKELAARGIHQLCRQSDRPFIPVNCAAVPSELSSSQLFGHGKGAFFGASYESIGCFRAANGGTLFLDEVAELDLNCQVQLLRVLQEGKVTPFGGGESMEVSTRTIAATSRDLAEEVRCGRFRLDLYHHLSTISMETMALGARGEDIEPLANHFLAKSVFECGLPLKELTPDAMQLLMSYCWPGNVLELEQFIERAAVCTVGHEIGCEAFPDIQRTQEKRSRISLLQERASGRRNPQPSRRSHAQRMLRADRKMFCLESRMGFDPQTNR